MKIYLIFLPIILLGCAEEIPPPEFDTFQLIEEGRFQICFKKTYSEHKIMLALEIKNKDGSLINRKWHDEYQVLYDGSINGGSKCYDSAFINFMSAANSTPKDVNKILHNHKDSMIQEIKFNLATSKRGEFRSKVPKIIYSSGIFNPLSNKVNLLNHKSNE